LSPGAPACAPPDFAPRRPRLALPRGACDCHAHILGPASVHPYAARRVYTPPDCLLPDYECMLAALGLERAVLVQPSVYGDDNTVLVEALERGDGRYRGVAVVQADVADLELARLNARGVRGVRVNVVDVGGGRPRPVAGAARRARGGRPPPRGAPHVLLAPP
jgi:2-pyrone-4,6-dicarboxylate lactonase